MKKNKFPSLDLGWSMKKNAPGTRPGALKLKISGHVENMSPSLEWSGIAAEAKSLALICDDPDAPVGIWVHWIVWNIPVQTKGLPEKAVPGSGLPAVSKQGTNDFKRQNYGDPCPPSGTHRYYFKLYALDSELGLKDGAAKAELLKAMDGHVLAEGSLMGRYIRK
jgi:hypothetical protein